MFKGVPSHLQCVRRLLALLQAVVIDCPRVLVIHGLALNRRADNLCTEQYRFSEKKVWADVFSPFDYTALGHLHSTEMVAERICYAPSPILRGHTIKDGAIGLVPIEPDCIEVDYKHLIF